MSESKNINNLADEYSFEELEAMLSTAKTLVSRNAIRQAIRDKKKSKIENKTDETEFTNTNVPRKLTKTLSNSSDYKEPYVVTKNLSQLIPTSESSNVTTIKSLVINKDGSCGGESVKLYLGENLELVWILPFKLLRSIQFVWKRDSCLVTNRTKVESAGLQDRYSCQYDGYKVRLELRDLRHEDSGIFSLEMCSSLLVHNTRKFFVRINSTSSSSCQNEEISFVELLRDDMGASVKDNPKDNLAEKCTKDSEIRSDEAANSAKERPRKYRPVQRHKTIGSIHIIKELSKMNVTQERKPEPQVNQVVAAPIRRFNRSSSTVKEYLVTFCAINTMQYLEKGVVVENMSKSWGDGMAFCGLVHNFFPNAFDFDSLLVDKGDRRRNFTLAFDTAERYADVPQLLSVEDMLMVEVPDWKCVFTYLQCFYKALRDHPNNKLKIAV